MLASHCHAAAPPPLPAGCEEEAEAGSDVANGDCARFTYTPLELVLFWVRRRRLAVSDFELNLWVTQAAFNGTSALLGEWATTRTVGTT